MKWQFFFSSITCVIINKNVFSLLSFDFYCLYFSTITLLWSLKRRTVREKERAWWGGQVRNWGIGRGKKVHGGQIDPILWQNASWQYTRFNFIVESCENRTNDGREEKRKGQSEGKMMNTNDKRKEQGEEEMKSGGRTCAAWVTNRHGTRGPRGVNNNKSNVGGDILCKKEI